MDKQRELGRFVRWGAPVAIDAEGKMLIILPEAEDEDLVEIPLEDVPTDDELGMRLWSY